VIHRHRSAFTARAGDPSAGDRRATLSGFTASLQIPGYLAPGVACCYYALTDTDRDGFNRALYWFAHAQAIYPVSFSAAFAALVQAIEVLTARPGPRDPCPECQQDRSPGSTARFKDFLTGVGVDRKTCDTFYKVRSDILHASRVLLTDIDGLFSTGLHPGSFEFYTNYDPANKPRDSPCSPGSRGMLPVRRLKPAGYGAWPTRRFTLHLQRLRRLLRQHSGTASRCYGPQPIVSRTARWHRQSSAPISVRGANEQERLLAWCSGRMILERGWWGYWPTPVAGS
jgi:hypothetical protein